jgi:histidinol-phosphate phosphatase family protein
MRFNGVRIIAAAAGYFAFVVTNQSGVARGLFEEAHVRQLREYMAEELAKIDAHIDAFKSCPDHPEAVVERYRHVSDRRKPAPGMILDLLKRFPVDVSSSILIGDKPADLEAAQAAPGATEWTRHEAADFPIGETTCLCGCGPRDLPAARPTAYKVREFKKGAEMATLSYASYTRNTTEPLKRIAHSRRYEQLLRIIARPLPADKVLDYGCADGHLFSHLVGNVSSDRLVGYDPNADLLAQADPAVVAGSNLTTDINRLKAEHCHSFSLIYCVEVCEHLTDKALEELFENITELAAPSARIIVGVPIETGASGFLKTMYRVARGRRQDASLTKAFRALLGSPITRKVTDVEWYGDHTGFSHARLREKLEDHGFLIRRSSYLPFPWFGVVLNNEIYFTCCRREQS